MKDLGLCTWLKVETSVVEAYISYLHEMSIDFMLILVKDCERHRPRVSEGVDILFGIECEGAPGKLSCTSHCRIKGQPLRKSVVRSSMIRIVER